MCVCSPDYNAGWKEIEKLPAKGISISALLANLRLQKNLNISEEPITRMKPQEFVDKKHQLRSLNGMHMIQNLTQMSMT